MVLSEYGKPLEERGVPDRAPGSNEVLIDVEAAALCASDVHAQAGGYSRATGRFPALTPPILLGHQIAGRVVECGAEVQSAMAGERCVVFCYLYCGSCLRCLSARQNLCERVAKRIGFEVEGGFAERVVVPEHNAFPISSDVVPAEAAVLPDAVSTSYHGVVTRGGIKHGEKVLILGTGALGLYAVRLSALRGADVVAVDRADDERLEWARRFGARKTLAWRSGISPESFVDQLRKAVDTDVDVVVDLVGSSATLSVAAELLRPKGRLVTIGVSARGSYPAKMLAQKSIRVLGSLASTPADLLSVLDLHRRGQIQPLVSDTLSLPEVNDGLEALRRGSVVGRLVVVPGG
jgi:D-arabinose 1-dehydrogenase-like Zn-dependent alcohol dehydrogenase